MIAFSQNCQAAESISERREGTPSSRLERFCGLFHVPGMLLAAGVPLMVPVPQAAAPGLDGRSA